MSKKKVLILTDWYLPAVKAGGPVRSVSAIVERLKSTYEISILTSDRDVGDTSPFSRVLADQWIENDGYRVRYLSPEKRRAMIRSEVNSLAYHKIYMNSLFSFDFTILPLRALNRKNRKRVILAPRGMLGKGALALKPFKKNLFLRLSRWFGLFDGITWHASTVLEAEEIKAKFPKARVVSLINLPACVTQNFQSLTKNANELRLCFVSRISRKKNLLFAIEAIKESMLPIHLDVYGPKEEEAYWSRCLEKGDGMVNYKGVLDPGDLNSVLASYQFMMLPTRHENFGHIILECLNASTPVILSDHTPWLDLEKESAGFVLPLERDKWSTLLNELYQMDGVQYEKLRLGAHSKAKTEIDQPKLIAEYVSLFS